jgi:hypothetical protein
MPKQRDWWCRLYSEVVDDDKLTWIADTTGERRVVILGVWSGLLALANRSPQRGALLLAEGVPYTVPMLARKLDIDAPELESIMTAMAQIGLINDGHLVAFDKRNPVSDDATTRQQERRARGIAVPVVTDLSRDKVVTPAVVVTPASISTITIALPLSLSSGEGESEGEGAAPPNDPPAVEVDVCLAALVPVLEAAGLVFNDLAAAELISTIQEHPRTDEQIAARVLQALIPNLPKGDRITPAFVGQVLELTQDFPEAEIHAAIASAPSDRCRPSYIRGTIVGQARDRHNGNNKESPPAPDESKTFWRKHNLSRQEYANKYPSTVAQINEWEATHGLPLTIPGGAP